MSGERAFLYRMPAGIPGGVQRHHAATVEPGQLDPAKPALAYGILVKLSSGKWVPVEDADSSFTDVSQIGFLARPFPVQEPLGVVAADQGFGGGKPDTGRINDIMRRGYMTVQITSGGGTAFASVKKGDQVYVRVDAASGKAIGDLEAGSASGNTAIAGAYFVGGVDSNGLCEIEFNI